MSQRFAVFITTLVFMVLLGSALAQAQTSRIYFAGYLGLSTFNDQEFKEASFSTSGDIELDNAPSYAGALGLRLSQNFRVEGEISYRSANMDQIIFSGGGDFELGGELTSWLALANLYYDFDVDWKLQPYIGAGVGFGWHEGEFESSSASVVNTSDDTTGIAWQVGTGMKYRIDPQMAFTGSYRYVDAVDLDFGSYELDYGGHEFRIGLEYDLPVE